MQGEDDLRGLAKIMAFMRAVSILLVLMHFYWFCYGFFAERGWTLEIIGKILTNFNRTAGLFEHPLIEIVGRDCHIALHPYNGLGIYSLAHGRGMDEPTTPQQSDGRCLQ